MTLDDLFDMWEPAQTTKIRTRLSHREHYRRHLAPALGNREIATITRADVARLLGELITCGLSPRTVRNIATTLSVVLEHAVDADVLPVNPTAGVRRPRVPKMRPDNVLSPAQLAEMAERHGSGGDVTTALGWTGLRWSELTGLQVRDFAVNPRPTIKVRRQLLRVPGHGLVITTPKSHAARTVPVPDPAVSTFVAATRGRGPDELLFTTPSGSPLNPSNWRRAVDWIDTLAAMDVVGFRPHDLRHTAASYWISCGADVKQVQAILGHASAEMTLDVYGHLLDEGLAEAAARINAWAARRG